MWIMDRNCSASAVGGSSGGEGELTQQVLGTAGDFADLPFVPTKRIGAIG